MSAGKVLLGLLAGFAAGATLGILLAPDKGSSTRKKMIQKRDAYAAEFGLKFDEFIADVNQKFETAKKEAARMVKNGKAKAEETNAEVI